MKPILAALTQFVALIALSPFASSITYTPTTTTDFPVTGAGVSVNSTTGVITGGTGNGQVTLRSAISAANANAGADTINLPTGTYTLTITGNNEQNNATGDLDI